MRTDNVTRADVAGRARVDKLAPAFPAEALKVARAIAHPWYRCQSLAKVAEHTKTSAERLKLLREALETAHMEEDINRVVTVASWPLRVMAPAAPNETRKHLSELVAHANQEPHTLRRSDALMALAYAVNPNEELLKMVLPSLIKALLAGHGWRIDRLIRFTVPLVKPIYPQHVAELVAHHTDNRKRRQFVTSLEKPHGV
jgi:hypothetical protein